MPSINRLAEQLAPQGLTVLLVNLSEPRQTVTRVVRERGYTARVVLDPEGRATQAYGITATPTVFLVGRDGTLLGRAIGPRPWAQPDGRALLAALLSAHPRPGG